MVGQLAVRQPQALGDDVGVREQLLAGGRHFEAAAAAVQKTGADLPLERGHLLGDGRLGERQRLAGARERSMQRDLAEGQHAPRIEH